MILENAGCESSVIINKLLKKKNYKYGFDANKEKYVNMLAAGIIDPMKVVRTAL